MSIPENPPNPAATVPGQEGQTSIPNSAGWVIEKPKANASTGQGWSAPLEWGPPRITPPPPTVQPAPARPWIIALAIVSVFALFVGGAATGVGGLALWWASGGGWGPGVEFGDDPPDSFGDRAVYGEYVGFLEFTGVRSDVGLDTGMCFTVDDLDSDLVGKVAPHSCDEPHTQEAYERTTIPGDEFPGYDSIGARVYDTCQDAFADYLEADYEESGADFGGLAPTERGWEEGKRDIVCFTFLYSNERSGSLRGSGL